MVGFCGGFVGWFGGLRFFAGILFVLLVLFIFLRNCKHRVNLKQMISSRSTKGLFRYHQDYQPHFVILQQCLKDCSIEKPQILQFSLGPSG